MQPGEEIVIKDISDSIKTIQKSIEQRSADPQYAAMKDYLTGYADACRFILEHLEKKQNTKPEV